MLEGDAKDSLVENDIKEEIKKSPNKTRIILFVTIGAVISGIIVVLVIYFIRNSLEEESKKELKFISWEEAHQKAEEKMKLFSIDEKLSILFGIQNMQKKPEDKGCVGAIEPIKEKFGGICLQDGPAGVRFSTSTQSWQAAINTVSTFNKSLMYEVGKAQGKEFREKGVNVALTPAMNIQRNPQGGRIWESFGDDPFLAGVAATQIIKGIQSNGVIACAKHYVGNDQETNRKNSSSNIKEQALWEIYLEPFIRSVQDAEVGAIMAAYNAINYTYVINNTRIVQNYLKEKIGYRGYVMSDWWAITSDDPNIFTSGIDMNMPGGKYEGDKSIGRNESFWSKFKDHLGNEIPYERLDDAVERILAPMFKLDQFNEDIKFPEIDLMKNTITEETKKLNFEAAMQSNILLKNENNILPLKNMRNKTIAIIGNDADESPCIRDSDCSCKSKTNNIYKGHIALGYGSGTTYFNYSISPLSAISARAQKEGINIKTSVDITKEKEIISNHTIDVGKENIYKAKEIAKDADICIVFLSADSGEQYISLEQSVGDRYDLNAWHSGNELVEAVLEVNDNVIVIINAPGPINLPWLDKIKALIFSGFGGAESGDGITSILFGDYNPSGHLPYIWAELDN
jgi:beta-glucosidase